MLENNLKDIIKLLQVLARLELKIAELYTTCAERWETKKDFWNTLGDEEKRHSGYVKKMAIVVEKYPQKFESGHKFPTVAVETVIKGIDEYIRRIKDGSLDFKKILNISLNIEDSLLEKKFYNVVKTENIKYNEFIGRIREETQDHRKKIKEEIRAVE